MREMPDAELRGYLRDEYLFLQQNLEDFDRRALSIKGWVASGTVAALAISFGKDIEPKWAIPWFAIALSLTFWALEAGWKLYQYGFRDRIRIIEAYFRADPDIILKDPPAFQSYSAWRKSFGADEAIYPYELAPGAKPRRRPQPMGVRFLSAALHPFVALPYAVIIVLSVASFWLLPSP